MVLAGARAGMGFTGKRNMKATLWPTERLVAQVKNLEKLSKTSEKRARRERWEMDMEWYPEPHDTGPPDPWLDLPKVLGYI